MCVRAVCMVRLCAGFYLLDMDVCGVYGHLWGVSMCYVSMFVVYECVR